MANSLPEPWLRGDITGLHPISAQVLYTFRHASEDLKLSTEGLSADQLWTRPYEVAPVAFHVRHIGGSVDRLLTYAQGLALSENQLNELRAEMPSDEGNAGADRESLLSELQLRFEAAERILRSIEPSSFLEARGVGKKRLPTTVGGLLVHIAEHTQRHVGQAVIVARIVRGMAARDERP